jgi:hypothetical protein
MPANSQPPPKPRSALSHQPRHSRSTSRALAEARSTVLVVGENSSGGGAEGTGEVCSMAAMVEDRLGGAQAAQASKGGGRWGETDRAIGDHVDLSNAASVVGGAHARGCLERARRIVLVEVGGAALAVNVHVRLPSVCLAALTPIAALVHHVESVRGLMELDAPCPAAERPVVVQVRVHSLAQMHRPLRISIRGGGVGERHLRAGQRSPVPALHICLDPRARRRRHTCASAASATRIKRENTLGMHDYTGGRCTQTRRQHQHAA